MDPQNQNPNPNASPQGNTPSSPITDPMQVLGKLTEQLNKLEEKLSKPQQAPKEVDIEGLIEELQQTTQPRQAPQPQVDVSQLSPEQAMGYVINTVKQQLMTPIIQKVEELNLKLEIKDLNEKYGRGEFEKFKGEIWKLAKQNPYLTVEQAYKLANPNAKARDEEPQNPTPNPNANPQPSNQRNMHMQNFQRMPIGDKRGIPPSTVTQNPKRSTRQAAIEAVEEELGKLNVSEGG